MSTCDNGKTAPDIFYSGRSGKTLFLGVENLIYPCPVGAASGNLIGRVTLFGGAAGIIFVDLLYGFGRFSFDTRRFF